MRQSKIFLQPKQALTKTLCHTYQTFDMKRVVGRGEGLSESVKKGKFVTKIFFPDVV